MAEFRIEIAEHVFAVRSRFDSTRDYCRNYLTEKPPDFTLEVLQEDLIFEQAALDEEAREEGMKRRKFTDPFLERTVIQRKVAQALLDRNILLLHGSAVAMDGQGYLFTARCGTGKSTHTRLWREVFGNRAVMVNDDKPFLRITPQGVTLYGAPWSGKHGLDTNTAVPLKGICILTRGTENRIFPITPADALPMLLHQSQPPLNHSSFPAYRQLVTHLAEAVPLWQMECTKDPQAAMVAWESMSANPLNRKKGDRPMAKLCQTEFASQRKELLENSLLNLLAAERYQDITVKDICLEADIPRRTFYHYFDSKDDVLESLIESTMMGCYLDVMFDLHLGADRMKSSFVRIFQFWQGENRKKLDILMKNGLEPKLMSHALKWTQSDHVGILHSDGLNPKLVEIGLMVGVTDFFSLLFYWSRNGYQETPEQMAEYAIWVLPQAFYTL